MRPRLALAGIVLQVVFTTGIVVNKTLRNGAYTVYPDGGTGRFVRAHDLDHLDIDDYRAAILQRPRMRRDDDNKASLPPGENKLQPADQKSWPPPPPRNRTEKDKETVPLPAEHSFNIACFRDRPTPLSSGDYFKAVELFGLYCSYYRIPPNGHVAVVHGNVVIYACDFDGKWQGCSKKEYLQAALVGNADVRERYWHMDSYCGHNIPASYYVSKWKKAYGRDIIGRPLCPRKKLKNKENSKHLVGEPSDTE